jgi:hypothetical protein
MNTVEILSKDAYTGDRESKLFKVNFTSLNKHQTIEFRQREAGADPEQIIKWVRSLIKFIRFAVDEGEPPAEYIIGTASAQEYFDEIFEF